MCRPYDSFTDKFFETRVIAKVFEIGVLPCPLFG
jgi:hypothetical protein